MLISVKVNCFDSLFFKELLGSAQDSHLLALDIYFKNHRNATQIKTVKALTCNSCDFLIIIR